LILSPLEERDQLKGLGRSLSFYIYDSRIDHIFIPTGKRAVKKDGGNDDDDEPNE